MPAKPGATSALVSADWHIGMHDPLAIALFLRCCEVSQPGVIVLNGDLLDCAELHKTTYNRRPHRPMLTWQEECIVLRYLLAELRGMCKSARIVYLEGNHEQRLTKRLVEHAPHLMASTAPLPEYLGLESLRIEWIPAGEYLQLWGFDVGHQLRAGLYGFRTSMLETGGNSITGHVHRLACISSTTPTKGLRHGCTCGCLCSLGPIEYTLRKYPDWQQGFLQLTRYNGQRAIPHLIPIVDRRAMYPGYSVSRSEVMVNELWQPMVDELAGSDRGRYEQLILG